MIESDKRNFQDLMNGVMAIYYKPAMDKDALRIWWAKLADYDFALVCRAFNEYTQSPRHPPTPADIVQLCKQQRDRVFTHKLEHKRSDADKQAGLQRIGEIYAKFGWKRQVS